MNNLQTAAMAVAAQESCAQKLAMKFPGMGTVEQQPHFSPILRRDLMAAVNTVAKDLGLRSTAVQVLDSLMSCLPCPRNKSGQDTPVTPLTLLTVYAANNTLCFRAKNITDRQLRRHLDRLEEIGLIKRRDSANGKRFPIRRGGATIGAFGIDLSPLFAQSSELRELAAKKRNETEELKGIKSCIRSLCAQCLDHSHNDDTLNFIEGTRKALRRVTTTLNEAKALLKKLQSILENALQAANMDAKVIDNSKAETTEPADTKPATGGQNVRHIDTPKSETKKRNPSQNLNWADLDVITSFYPTEPTTSHRVLQIIYEFGKAIRLDDRTIALAIQRLGIWRTLCLQNQIAKKFEQIGNPAAYLRALATNPSSGKVGHGQLFQS